MAKWAAKGRPLDRFSHQRSRGCDMEYLHVSIEINGVKLEVIGNYWPEEAASWDSPGESESVEIEKS